MNALSGCCTNIECFWREIIFYIQNNKNLRSALESYRLDALYIESEAFEQMESDTNQRVFEDKIWAVL